MKYTKERHIVFQEANVTEILIDWLKRSGEKDLPAAEEIELSFDKYKHGNEITLMFDDITEPNIEDILEPNIEDILQVQIPRSLQTKGLHHRKEK